MRELQVGNLGRSVHWSRWFRQKNGETIEDIAKADRVQESAVKESLRQVEMFRGRHTSEHLNEQTIGVVMSLSDPLKHALLEGLTATFEVKDGNKTKHEPDHAVRMQAVEKVKELIKVVQPKTPGGTHVQVGIGIRGGGGAADTGTAYIGMEERMRGIREKMSAKPLLEGRVVQTAVLESDHSEDGDEEEEED